MPGCHTDSMTSVSLVVTIVQMGWSEHAANVHTEGLEESQSLFIKD